jgi:hypothetical protein
MRAKPILLLSTLALAACGSTTGPDEATAGAPTPSVVSTVPRSGGSGASGGGTVPATTGVTPPCLPAVRLASDKYYEPPSCQR